MTTELATIREAVALVQSDDTVLLSGQAATLTEVSDALGQRDDLDSVTVESMHWEGPVHHMLNPGVRHRAWFMSEPLRAVMTATGRMDWNPMSLSLIPQYLSDNPPDVVFAHVAPPVRGHVSMGTSCDVMFAGLQSALRAHKTLVAVVNPLMPYTLGHTVPLSMFTHVVDINRQPFGQLPDQLTCTDASIAGNLAGVLPDGATIAGAFYAIVGATQIDLAGNVAAHCVPTPDGGYRPYSGRGGHCDLLRGARYSDGGAGIVVMPSTAHGESRLVPALRVPVTTPGEYIDYVVTDKGATPNLRWMTVSQRACALERVFS